MIIASALRSGKTHRDENFPVASWLIHPRHRRLILAFYEFVRTADDIADHPGLAQEQKLESLQQLEANLDGFGEHNPEAATLRTALAERGMAPQHAKDLLQAFRLDVTKLRYRDWDDLLGYCRYSAMPVGRFVLDVHEESATTWPTSDALCAALQIINHLQDCKSDFCNLNRVYIPLDMLATFGGSLEALGANRSSPALQRCLRAVAEKTDRLLGESDRLPSLVSDLRLSFEISVIQQLAHRLIRILMLRDPLRERVHLNARVVAGLSAVAVIKRGIRSLARRPSHSVQLSRDP